ncbi:Guanine nucleotide exchange factor subunit RGP1 [Nakaseomyces bracarensis]|uniref:Guanine nucleotide exchange factor subunit RGP1 n=1 Tax=Nakaseomyces bracarensis TaxID=273131 RepID=A0ABR4NWY6_9SACH
MHSHRIDTFYTNDNVRIEVIHESNPFFAGEPISVIIRIRHLGSLRERDITEKSLQEINEKINVIRQNCNSNNVSNNNTSDSKWSFKTIFSKKGDNGSTENSIDVNLSEEEKQKLSKLELAREKLIQDLKFNSQVTLLSSYVQVSGKFQFDNSLIDKDSFKSSDSKILGLNYEDPTMKMLNDSSINKFNNYLNSDYENIIAGLKFVARDSNKIINDRNIGMGDSNRENMSAEYEQIPLLLVPQSLVFTEVTLNPGDVKTFLFRSLPLDKQLCPSYMVSDLVSVLYDIELGITSLIDGNLVPLVKKLPITIAPFVTEGGLQASSLLDRQACIQGPGTVREIKTTSSYQRKVSSASGVSFDRRSSVHERRMSINFDHRNSIASMFKEDTSSLTEKMKMKFTSIIEEDQNDFKDIEKAVDSLLKLQFNKDSEASDIEIEEEGKNEEFIVNRKRSDSVRDHIAGLENTPNGQYHAEISVVDGVKMIPQLVNLQKSYQINRNGSPIAKITFSKPFYMTSDDFDILVTLDQNSEQTIRITGISASLESFVLINPKYSVDRSGKVMKPKGKSIAEAHAISFDQFSSIPLKLSPSKTPTNNIAGQFKTDIFEHKWMLLVKFVLKSDFDESNLDQFYEDKKGKLFHSKVNLEGEDFSCHIPVPILTASDDFGGW